MQEKWCSTTDPLLRGRLAVGHGALDAGTLVRIQAPQFQKASFIWFFDWGLMWMLEPILFIVSSGMG